ncbi:Tpo5p, partial [Ascoidea rubescens DSM 1968]
LTDEPQQIEHFNYKQELNRKLTLPSILGLSFSVMSIPLGISTTMYTGLIDGGAVTIFYGWIIVFLMSLCVAMSLGEMSGKYPSAGGIYHWSYIFANSKYNLITSFYCGWLLLIGNWTMCVSNLFSGAQFILSIFGIIDTTYHPHSLVTLFVFFLLVLICAIINLKFSKHLDRINKVCIYWTIYTVLIIDILLMIFSPRFNDLKSIFTSFDSSRSGWPAPIAFIIGFQQGAYTFQGFNLIPSMSDEVKAPEKNITKGMIYSVIIAGLTGIIFIIPLLTILPELALLLDEESNILPIEVIFKISSNSLIVTLLFVILICGTIIIGGIGVFTVASRSVYSLSRDNGIPFSKFWNQVSINNNENDEEGDGDYSIIPKNGIYLTTIILIASGIFSLFSTSAFNAFMGSAINCLTVSNILPILSSILNKRVKLKGSYFRLRSLGYMINVLSVFWSFFLLIVLSCPPRIPVNFITMNYTSLIFVLTLMFISLLYVVYGKNHFHGPLVDGN